MARLRRWPRTLVERGGSGLIDRGRRRRLFLAHSDALALKPHDQHAAHGGVPRDDEPRRLGRQRDDVAVESYDEIIGDAEDQRRRRRSERRSADALALRGSARLHPSLSHRIATVAVAAPSPKAGAPTAATGAGASPQVSRFPSCHGAAQGPETVVDPGRWLGCRKFGRPRADVLMRAAAAVLKAEGGGAGTH